MSGEAFRVPRQAHEVHTLIGVIEAAPTFGAPLGQGATKNAAVLDTESIDTLAATDNTVINAMLEPLTETGKPYDKLTVPDANEPDFHIEGPAEMPEPETTEALRTWKLVEQAQQGDMDAFAKLYDKYNDTVFRFIYYRTKQRELAEDLTSDTFARALRSIGNVTWRGKAYGAVLVTIARNLVADHYKSGRNRFEVTAGGTINADQTNQTPENSPEEIMLSHLANLTLLAAVKQLNPEQQQCIVLRFLSDMSLAEAAEIMSKNEGAIKAMQHRAVRRLREMLGDEKSLLWQ